MTISANLRRVSAMSAEQRGGTAWLKITGESAVETITVFMPLRQAEMIAEAFAAYNNSDAEEAYWTTREPDDRYTMDGLRRTQDEARALK